MYSFEVGAQLLRESLFVPAYRAGHVMTNLEKAGRVAISAIRDVALIRSGTYVRSYQPDGSLYLRVDNVREFVWDMNPEDLVRVDPSARGITSRVRVGNGDVVLARTGTLGKAAVGWHPIKNAVMSQHLTRLTPKSPSELYPGYLAAFLNSDFGKYQLLYSAYGSTRKELTHAALGLVRVPLPGREWQKDIHDLVMSALEGFYESVGDYTDAVSALETILGLPATTERNEVGFAANPGDICEMWTPRFHWPPYTQLVDWLSNNWDCRKLGAIARIQRGKGTRVSDYATKGLPFVRTSSLIDFGIDPFPDHYASLDTYESFQQQVRSGDILFSMEGKIGHVAYLTEEDSCAFKNHVELVRCDTGQCDPMYVFLCLSSRIGKNQAQKNTVVQATIPGMANRLRDFLIPMVPLDVRLQAGFQKSRDEVVRRGYQAAKKRAAATRKLREAARSIETEMERLAS